MYCDQPVEALHGAYGGRQTDLSAEALAVAKENAKALEAGVAFFRGDLFEAVTGRQMYDCIVSNPPYIRTEVIETLSEEVRAHEPYQALDGKEDGLYFYREIVRKCRFISEAGRSCCSLRSDMIRRRR